MQETVLKIRRQYPLAPCRTLRAWYPFLLILHGLINEFLSRVSMRILIQHFFLIVDQGLFCKCKRNFSWELFKNFFFYNSYSCYLKQKISWQCPVDKFNNNPVLRIRDFYPGSWIRPFSIPDPGSDFFPFRIPDPNFSIPDPGSA